MCIKGLKTLNTSENLIGKEADFINMKTKGFLTYPNSNLYIIIKHRRMLVLHANPNDDFEKTIEEFFKTNINLKFPCTIRQHQTDMLTNVFSYYITMRMRQHSYMQNQPNKKLNKTKKKLSKLVKT